MQGGSHSSVGGGGQVARFMRRDFISVSPRERLDIAADLMRVAMLRHLPVVEGGRLVGTVSHRRLLYALLALLADPGMPRGELDEPPSIADWVQPDPEAISVDASLGEAALRMLSHRVGYLPVFERDADGDHVVGIVTEADLLRIAYERGAFPCSASEE